MNINSFIAGHNVSRRTNRVWFHSNIFCKQEWDCVLWKILAGDAGLKTNLFRGFGWNLPDTLNLWKSVLESKDREFYSCHVFIISSIIQKFKIYIFLHCKPQNTKVAGIKRKVLSKVSRAVVYKIALSCWLITSP